MGTIRFKCRGENRMKEPYCGKYLGYTHLSGAKAYCGDDVVTHIIRCEKCRKKIKKDALNVKETTE